MPSPVVGGKAESKGTGVLEFFRFSRLTSQMRRSRSELSVAPMIPYTSHWDSRTILTKQRELVRVIRLSGFSFETADDEDVDGKKSLRNSLLKGISSGNFALYFHTIRTRRDIFGKEGVPLDPNLKFQKDFVSYLQHSWQQKHIEHQSYVNELYVSIVRKEDTKGAAFFEYLIQKIMNKTDKKAEISSLKESAQELEEISTRIMNALRDYGPEMLEIRYTPFGAYSEPLAFFSSIINGMPVPHFKLPSGPLDRFLSFNRLFFGNRMIEIRTPAGQSYAGMVSIKEYGPTTFAGILDRFLQMPFECIMTQSFVFTNRQVAISKMQIQQNRMIQAEDKAISQIREITKALDMAMSGTIAFGDHHLTVLCIEKTPKALDNALSLAAVELSNIGAVPVRETFNLEPAFWAQLPGNQHFVGRKATINTMNLASLASLHNYPAGKPQGNHWGEAVTVFDTTSGTPYFFNFHVRDVGHTTIIGPTGAGKTVLMNFLCAQAQKYKGRMFFFDKDRGAEIFIRAIGGSYTIVNASSATHFNPLQLADTPDNRNFLLEWLRLLVTANGEPLTTEHVRLLSSAIEGNYKLAQKDRILRNIAPFLGIEGDGSLASRLAMWHGYGSHAAAFDNERDMLNFDHSRVFGFEMAEILKDRLTLGPVLLYLFHRISIALDGTPTMIVLDEAWALIDNPIFAPKIKDWLKVLRKLNTFVIFATQSVEDASKSSISDTLIQQTATQIFLPNLRATDVYRKSFGLSQREYTLIKTTDPGSRFFLVKQGTNAIIARIDLHGMENIIHVLSGRSETVLLLDAIRQEVGDNPEVWLPIFYKRVKELAENRHA
jgi:type IV secretion system protein VirB4